MTSASEESQGYLSSSPEEELISEELDCELTGTEGLELEEETLEDGVLEDTCEEETEGSLIEEGDEVLPF
jgi:hypothetical protein